MEFSLDVAEVGPIADLCCKCTGACKTTRCICRKNGHGCTLGKCKCKSSKCSQLKEQAAVDIAALGTEVHSSDSEPEDYCVCTDACDTMLCYCIAILNRRNVSHSANVIPLFVRIKFYRVWLHLQLHLQLHPQLRLKKT